MAKRCYYEVLCITKTANDREISKSYRRLAVKFHPDSNPDDEEADFKFKEAAEAYDVLGDQDKRARYDRYGHAGVDGNRQFGNAEDIMSAFSEIFGGGGGGGGFFGDLFGGGGRRARRGGDVRADVVLTLEEAAQGASKTITFTRSEICATCSGSGARPGTQPTMCTKCGGRCRTAIQRNFTRANDLPLLSGQRPYDPRPLLRMPGLRRAEEKSRAGRGYSRRRG